MRIMRGIWCLTGFALLSSARSYVEYQKEPIQLSPPHCECPPIDTRFTGPAVGLALEIGYGTGWITYGNGTGVKVAKIKGSSQYVELMESLAIGPIKRMSDGSRVPPGVDIHDISTRPIWIWYRIKYWARKLLTLPATPEIRILADMVAQLRREAEAILGRPVKSVALSSPDRVRLTVYEIRDILDYLGMESLIREDITGIDQLFSMAAVATMSDISTSLCGSFANIHKWERYESYLRDDQWGLQLDYSNQSLSGAMDPRGTARRGVAPATFVDLALGADNRPLRDPDDDRHREQYWDMLEARIRDFVEANHPPKKLYLTGECAKDRRFLAVVRSALGGSDLPFMVENSLDIAYVTVESAEWQTFKSSAGAAQFAKLAQDAMASCQLPEQCRRWTDSRLPSGGEEL